MANEVVHVVILCQGQQTRLPDLANKKQLLPVYHRADGSPVTILGRTIAQVRATLRAPRITVVGDSAFVATCRNVAELATLGDPGNSSLKGLQRYLHAEHGHPLQGVKYPNTVVLLGDVVYTYDVLDFLCDQKSTAGLSFAMSSDLSTSGGELWGVAWKGGWYREVSELLLIAMSKYPPPQVDGTYQPGQLRRLYWEAERLFLSSCRVYSTTRSQYIMDVDKPDDLASLASIAKLVDESDREHGVSP